MKNGISTNCEDVDTTNTPSFLLLIVKICKLSTQSFFFEFICAINTEPFIVVVSFLVKTKTLLFA